MYEHKKNYFLMYMSIKETLRFSSKPEEKEGEDALILGKEYSEVFTVLTDFLLLRFKPFALVPVTYVKSCSTDTSELAVLALPFPRIWEISIIPMHATKSTHIIFVCRTTTAKAPTYINNIGCVIATL